MTDGLTKALQGAKFAAFIQQLNLVDIKERLEQKHLEEITRDDLEAKVQRAVDMADGPQN